MEAVLLDRNGTRVPFKGPKIKTLEALMDWL
jgi:hypothetical protein